MAAQPGWYDAGEPGRVRWWDGTQWTAHEAPVPSPSATALAPGRVPSVVAGPGGRPPGWYTAARGPVRWWDGDHWTGMRVKNGTPGIDWATAEQVWLAWFVAICFLGLSATQVMLAVLSPGVWFAGVSTVLVALLWVGIAIQTTVVLRIPAPTTDPLRDEVFRPLPGEQEGPGAGWYPVSSSVVRWWTGVRWTQYTWSRYGIRPTFHGPRTKAVLRVIAIVVSAVAVLAVVLGIVLIVLASAGPADSLTAVVGWVLVGGGVLFGGLGGFVIAMSRIQIRVFFPPTDPPRVGAEAAADR